jgi:hypothetical protein
MATSTFHQWAARIGSIIPGYTGYAERSDKRNADKIFRVGVAGLLRQAARSVEAYQADVMRKERTTDAMLAEQVRQRIQLLADKVEFARYGASGLFSAQEIREAELERIHALDHQVAECASSILTNSEAHLTTSILALSALLRACADLEKGLQERDAFIQQHK